MTTLTLRPSSLPVRKRLAASASASASGLHERPGPRLDVEHQPLGAFGELLREDARGDERDRLHGAGHVAQRVHLPVRRHDPLALADHGEARLAQALAKTLDRQVRAVAGDRLELVQRAAGVPQRASAHHRDLQPAGGGHGGEHERDLVAHARRWSACRRGARAGPRGRSRRPTPIIARVRNPVSSAAHAAKEHGHAERPTPGSRGCRPPRIHR